MEVHHHPDIHHKKKNIREYLLEFLMIFLAVSLGFFAESYREHIADAAKEKDYIKGIIRNLQTDTTSLRNVLTYNQNKLKGVDSIVLLARQDIHIEANRRLFYHYFRQYMSSVSTFHSDDETLTQLRNSGGYRLIQRGSAADSISQYDQYNTEIYTQGDEYRNNGLQIIDVMDVLIDITIFADTAYYHGHAFTEKRLPLVSDDPQKLKSYYNKIYFERGIVKTYIDYLKHQSAHAVQLITFLKQTYHLNDD
jgi:dynactin complex subunit